MDLNLIQTFLVVAEFQSYTKAAEQLGLTQPAVSAAIKRLEQVVDKQLFVKKGRGITLTSAAYQLLPQFEQAVSIIDNAITEKKHFEVYCSEILLHIMDPIKNTIFYESPPEKYILFELLRQQKADLVIDTVITKDAAFVMEEAYEEKAVIICREQLAQETILERKVELVTSSLAGMALYVAQRDCLGLVSQSFANKWSKALKLQVLPCPISIRTVPYKFVYHKRELNNPAHIALRERIKTHLTAVHYEPISL
ncbi:LysR family transcriptional regulator [Vibrio parahaemolyticus]|nr:LysR family transcriptional regulator [Vibrio parahaemolyticus]